MSVQDQELITIEANIRAKTGKELSRKLRRDGKIPVNLLDKGKSTHLELNPKLLSKAWRQGKTFNLNFEGKTRAVFIHELQIHPITRTAVHMDIKYV